MEQSPNKSGLPLAPPPDHIDDDTNAKSFFQDREEFEALGKIAHAFREYKTDAEWEIKRWEYNYSRQACTNFEKITHFSNFCRPLNVSK